MKIIIAVAVALVGLAFMIYHSVKADEVAAVALADQAAAQEWPQCQKGESVEVSVWHGVAKLECVHPSLFVRKCTAKGGIPIPDFSAIVCVQPGDL